MTQRTIIYPVFIPHRGCPFRCVYCNQHAVTSTPGGEAAGGGAWGTGLLGILDRLANEARRQGAPGEVAFYGGTFTALPLATIKDLLERANAWIGEGVFTGVRFSTRPDSMTDEVCRLLGAYPVRTVELGVQSLCNEVLARSGRGYTAEIVEQASHQVHRNGWSLGVQMMPGLPGDTRERFMSSMASAVGLRPSFVRIYPTLVLNGTSLAEWYGSGAYEPLSMEDSINWCAAAYGLMLEAGIPVARMGLHSDPEIRKPGRIVTGPYHPSFGYLVKARWWRDRIDAHLQSHAALNGAVRCVLRVPARFVSEVLGPGRSNVAHWRRRWGFDEVDILQEPGWRLTRFECFFDSRLCGTIGSHSTEWRRKVEKI